MATVREIEARLASEVEDRVSQRLGYREVEVWLPDDTVVTPRPIVKEVDEAETKRALSSSILAGLANPSRPVVIWKVEIPRTYTPQQIRVDGAWAVQQDGEGRVDCRALLIKRNDARWIVYLTAQRRTSVPGLIA